MAAQRVVLIVEDDPNFSRILEAKLHKNAYGVVIAPNASAALSSLLQRRFDLVLLDGRLPDADGLVALPLLRSAAPLTPFLFMTAYEEEYPRARALAAGASELLYKPFDLDRLMAEVARLIATPLPVAAETEKPRRRERREHPRVTLRTPVRLSPVPTTGSTTLDSTLQGMALDISEGGLALVASRPLAEGAEAEVHCSLGPGPNAKLTASARVVRVETVEGPPPLALHRMAVHFTEASPASRGLIERYVAAAQEN